VNTVDLEISEMLLGSESGYNIIYGREDKLDIKIRELCIISMLSTSGKSDQLLSHIQMAVRLGWTIKEIKEAQLLCIIPAGWPKALGSLSELGRYCEINKIPIEENLSIREDFYTRDWHKTGNDQYLLILPDLTLPFIEARLQIFDLIISCSLFRIYHCFKDLIFSLLMNQYPNFFYLKKT